MKKKLIKMLLMFGLVAGMLTGCGSSTDNYSATSSVEMADKSYDSGVASNSYGAEAEEAYDVSDDSLADNQTQNMDTMTLLDEKLVYHCDLNIETLDYSATMTSIKETIKKHNGVIQSESETDSGYDWYYENYRKTSGTMENYIQVRIPSQEYEAFLSELDGIGKIISKSTSVDNISQQYYDTTTQIEALKIQEENLLSMLEKCETIEDMITVQERLTQVQYELNRLQTDKRYMDVDVAYSYVNIEVSEVMEYHYEAVPQKRNTFIDRLGNTLKSTYKGFLAFLEWILFFIIGLSPYLLIAAVICFIFRKKIKKSIDDKKAEREVSRVQKEMHRQAVLQQREYQNRQQQAEKQDKEQNNQ